MIDGCPAGVALSAEHIDAALARRRPGQSIITSGRREDDHCEILSGVYEGRTLGTPIAVVVRSRDARSGDYDPNVFRIGHADRAWEDKFSYNFV